MAAPEGPGTGGTGREFVISIGVSLVVVTLLLAGSVVASFVWPRRDEGNAGDTETRNAS